MKKPKYVVDRLKELKDTDKVIIILYAYGMYVDNSRYGVNGDRDYKTKADILKNITNQDWYYAYYLKEETQTQKDGDYLVIKGSLTK